MSKMSRSSVALSTSPAVLLVMALAGPARADLVVSTVTGSVRANGSASARGYATQQYDDTRTFGALSIPLAVSGSAVSHFTESNAEATAVASPVSLGFNILTTNAGRAVLSPSDWPGAAIANGRSEVSITFLMTEAQPLRIAGRFTATGGVGSGPYGDGSLALFNPSGVRILFLTGTITGTVVDESLLTEPGLYRIDILSRIGIRDEGGGGFIGGSAVGGADLTITAVPGPGAAALLALAMPLAARRRR